MFIFTLLLLFNFSINTIQNISQRHDIYLEKKFNMYAEHVMERMCNDCYLANLINLFQRSSPYINQKNRLDVSQIVQIKLNFSKYLKKN